MATLWEIEKSWGYYDDYDDYDDDGDDDPLIEHTCVVYTYCDDCGLLKHSTSSNRDVNYNNCKCYLLK